MATKLFHGAVPTRKHHSSHNHVKILLRPGKSGTPSKLSLRLLGSGYSADTEPSRFSPNNADGASSRASTKSTMSTERTGFSSHPPVSIELLSRQRKRAVEKLEQMTPNKRFKAQEKVYDAVTAKSTLRREGIPVPPLRTLEPRILPTGSQVNMTTVKHLYSTALSSPFLCPQNVPVKSSAFMFNSCKTDLALLVKSCQVFYNAPPSTPTMTPKNDREYSESTASSLTDPDEMSSSRDDEVAVFSSIGDALAMSNTPRVVTMSEEPFTVVHVNAAFTKMTGFQSIKAQGQPLRSLLGDNSLIAAIKPQGSDALTSLRQTQSFRSRLPGQRAKSIKCSVSVSAVGPPGSATHFAMEVRNASPSRSTVGPVTNQVEQAIKVLG